MTMVVHLGGVLGMLAQSGSDKINTLQILISI